MSEQNQINWPVWATEAVELVEADPNWLRKGEQVIAQLSSQLAPYAVQEIEHIGSTAIPYLPAKPIIDIMASIPSYQKLSEIIHVLAKDNWHYVPPELDGRNYRRFFVKVKDNKRECHLHLMLEDGIGHDKWLKQLLFRDRLRANSHLTEEYAQLKHDIASKHNNNREAYTIAKTDFVNKVLTGTSE